MNEPGQKLSVYIKITDTSEFGNSSSCSVSREGIGIYSGVNNHFEEIMDTVVAAFNTYGYGIEVVKRLMLDYADDL